MAVDSSLEPPSRHRLDSFTDRERVMTHFQQMLCTAQAGEVHLLSIKGNSGTGKTFLIEYLTKRTCPQAGWRAGKFDFTQSLPDFRSILDGVEDTLKGCVPRQSLKQYRTEREEYKRRFDEYRAVITVNQSVEANEASSISHIQQYAQVDAELRRRERQLRAELTRALLELAEECEQSLCLFLDGYERLAEADPELVSWLWEEVLIKLVKNVPEPVLIITCGWEYPSSAALQPFSMQDELDDFDRLRIKSYLQAQHIISPDASAPNDEVLTEVFYDLTQGHPFVLFLAATYYQTLPESERSAESLQARQSLLDEEARVQWLDERLLSPNRMPEPFRTLLERGPILRALDQATLQILLQVGGKGNSDEAILEDRTYAQFLRYPFIILRNFQGSALLEKPTFHELTRRIRLRALRQWHPETKQRLHHAMVTYYAQFIQIAVQRSPLQEALQAQPSDYDRVKWLTEIPPAEWLTEIPQQEFHSLLEFFYHALQIKEMQEKVFHLWLSLARRAVQRWQREQAGPLLNLVQQLIREDEPLFDKYSVYYGQYLIWYSGFLEQEARQDDALLLLQEAAQVFERGNYPLDQADCFNNIGYIHLVQGRSQQAMDYFQRSLPLYERASNLDGLARSLNNIGGIYISQGQLDAALEYLQRALPLREQGGNPIGYALSLNNIGSIYISQGQLDAALEYLQRALSLAEQVSDPYTMSLALHNIGFICQERGQLDTALDYCQRALSIAEQRGDPAGIAMSLNNIGGIYTSQGQLDLALDYFQRALPFHEQVGNPAKIARSLKNIGYTYKDKGQLDLALEYLQRALSLAEQIGNPANITVSLHDVGRIYQEQGQFQRAVDYFQRALPFYEQVGSPAEIAYSLEVIGSIYKSKGQLDLALDYFQRALSLAEQIGTADIVRLNGDISSIYRQRGEIDIALDYYQRTLPLTEQLGDPAEIARLLKNIGHVYKDKGQLDLALDYYQRALPFYEQAAVPANIARSSCSIGFVYASQGQLDKAMDYYQRAFSLKELVGNLSEDARTFNGIGARCFSLGRLVLQRDFTSVVPATEQEVACDGSDRQRSCGVADRRSKPRPQAHPTQAGATRPARADAPEPHSAAGRSANPGWILHPGWARDASS